MGGGLGNGIYIDVLLSFVFISSPPIFTLIRDYIIYEFYLDKLRSASEFSRISRRDRAGETKHCFSYVHVYCFF